MSEYQKKVILLEKGALGCNKSQKTLKRTQRECITGLQNINYLTWLRCINKILDKYIGS